MSGARTRPCALRSGIRPAHRWGRSRADERRRVGKAAAGGRVHRAARRPCGRPVPRQSCNRSRGTWSRPRPTAAGRCGRGRAASPRRPRARAAPHHPSSRSRARTCAPIARRRMDPSAPARSSGRDPRAALAGRSATSAHSRSRRVPPPRRIPRRRSDGVGLARRPRRGGGRRPAARRGSARAHDGAGTPCGALRCGSSAQAPPRRPLSAPCRGRSAAGRSRTARGWKGSGAARGRGGARGTRGRPPRSGRSRTP